MAELHATAARWWAGQDRPIHALDHATRSRNPALLSDLLRRFAMPLILTGDHAAAAPRAGRHGCAGHRGPTRGWP